MSETYKRIQEAEILLKQALDSLNSPVVFRANLNAFIGSARNITWIMKKEFNSKSGFNEWYEKKVEQMNRDGIFKLFATLCNESVKERSLGNKVKFTTDLDLTLGPNQEAIIPALKVSENNDIIIQDKVPIMINGKPTPDIEHNTHYSYFFDQRPNDDAIELSIIYLDRLRHIVAECYSIFP